MRLYDKIDIDKIPKIWIQILEHNNCDISDDNTYEDIINAVEIYHKIVKKPESISNNKKFWVYMLSDDEIKSSVAEFFYDYAVICEEPTYSKIKSILKSNIVKKDIDKRLMRVLLMFNSPECELLAKHYVYGKELNIVEKNALPAIRKDILNNIDASPYYYYIIGVTRLISDSPVYNIKHLFKNNKSYNVIKNEDIKTMQGFRDWIHRPPNYIANNIIEDIKQAAEIYNRSNCY